jgi:very-short-patch-repair endonuclease
MDDFVITQAIEKDGHLHATAIQDAQRTPSALVTPGVLVTREWTRVPEPKEDGESGQ